MSRKSSFSEFWTPTKTNFGLFGRTHFYLTLNLGQWQEISYLEKDVPKGPTDYWEGLHGGNYPDCVRACENFVCLSDLNWRRDNSLTCTKPQ